MKILLGIIGFVIVGILLIRFQSRQKAEKIECAFSGREHLSTEQFYDSYFSEQGVPFHVVAGVSNILAEQFDVDMSRLSAADDFSENLHFLWDFDSMADVEIIQALEKQFGIQITDQEAEKAVTVRDIVNLVCGKIALEIPKQTP
jgi:acyl carrier protein